MMIVFFTIYLLALISLLLFKWLPLPGIFPARPQFPHPFPPVTHQVNLKPFHSLELFWNARGNSLREEDIWKNLSGNILVFVPYAFLASFCTRRIRPFKIFLSGFCLILVIELLQLISGIGVWDIDDILLNSAGLSLGLMLLLFRRRPSPSARSYR